MNSFDQISKGKISDDSQDFSYDDEMDSYDWQQWNMVLDLDTSVTTYTQFEQ